MCHSDYFSDYCTIHQFAFVFYITDKVGNTFCTGVNNLLYKHVNIQYNFHMFKSFIQINMR
jgi:hypothetical protein